MKSVLILAPKGVELLELAAFTDVLGWADRYSKHDVKTDIVGKHQISRCTFGPPIAIYTHPSQVVSTGFDALAVPGGFERAGFCEDAYSEPFLRLIRAFDEQHKPIASICTGALPLAQSGILKGRKGTTYPSKRNQLVALGVEVVDAPLVIDGYVITSAAPATAMNVAFKLLELLTDAETVTKIRGRMGCSM